MPRLSINSQLHKPGRGFSPGREQQLVLLSASIFKILYLIGSLRAFVILSGSFMKALYQELLILTSFWIIFIIAGEQNNTAYHPVTIPIMNNPPFRPGG
jgi:hypothetical protein